jgi:hypothetical protein
MEIGEIGWIAYYSNETHVQTSMKLPQEDFPYFLPAFVFLKRLYLFVLICFEQ